MNPDSEAAKAVREEERRKAAHAKVQNLRMTPGKVPPKVMVGADGWARPVRSLDRGRGGRGGWRARRAAEMREVR